RERVLSDDELRMIWNALPDSDYGSIVKILLLAGARRAEIGGLLWDEVGLKRGTIILSANRVKNGRTHVLPMSQPVRAILAAMSRIKGRDYVFGTDGEAGFNTWGLQGAIRCCAR